ncbi:MAG: glycosyltransferase family 4 protein [bacterium]|nr:glycosyltransferase family 4 protein [bacterium]
MRVAFINELYGTRRQGGEQEAMMALALRLGARKDFEVDVYSYTGKNSRRLDFHWPEKLRLTPYLREITAAPALGKMVASKIAPHYDVIHTSSTTLFGSARCPKPLVYSLHAIRSQKARFLSAVPRYRLIFNPVIQSWLKSLEQRSLSQASRVVVLRQRMTDFLTSELGLDNGKIRQISNPVDTGRFSPAEKTGSGVVFVGRATEAKGIDTLIAAAPKIKSSVTVVTKIMRPEIKRQCETAGIRLVFDVEHEGMPSVYRAAAVFALPSLDEEQPLTVLEAMASGLPVVATETGGAGLVIDGVNGSIVPSGDADGLARSINALLASPELVKQIGATNRQKVSQEHSWETILRAYVELYQSLADKRNSS